MHRTDGRTASESSSCGCGGSTTSSGCGSCDGLQCLCRPRFFDGQLITAKDFTRLDQYQVAKDRMHNRYLHGVGVVCGLEVVCNTCDDTVTVRTGYALGPCGEDIVVCDDVRVDVGALVRQHRKEIARRDCPPYSDPPQDCEATRQKWVLGICYDERPARSVTTLRRRESAGSCGGGCGGGGAGGCGCGSTTTPPAQRTPTSCEPTAICEGYRFTLTRVPTRSRDDSSRELEGDLPARVRQCLEVLRKGLTSLPKDPDPDELVTYCCDLKSDLRDLIDSGNVHDCTLGQRLGDVVCPDSQDQQVVEKAMAAIVAMLRIAVDLFRSCVCSALLPPCDTGPVDDCVPLAVVTVRSSDLRVLDICNWSARKFALTAPGLSYWFGWLPVFDGLRDLVERLCCGQAGPRFSVDRQLRVSEARATGSSPAAAATAPTAGARAGRTASAATAATSAGDGGAAPSVKEIHSMIDLAAHYLRSPSGLSGVDATVLGSLGGLDTDARPLASDLELGHPLEALVLSRAATATAAVLPPDVLDRLRRDDRDTKARDADGGAEQSGDADRLASLEKAMTALKRTVDAQAKTIRALRQKGPGA